MEPGRIGGGGNGGGGDGGGGDGGGDGGGGALGARASSHSCALLKCVRIASKSLPKYAKSELGADAIAVIVDTRAPPNPTDTTATPAFFTTAACAIAVLSSPSVVCTPSVSSRLVRGPLGRGRDGVPAPHRKLGVGREGEEQD